METRKRENEKNEGPRTENDMTPECDNENEKEGQQDFEKIANVTFELSYLGEADQSFFLFSYRSRF